MTTEDPPIPVRATAADDPDFPIAWEPGEAELEWEWDDMHSPRAVPPLSEDYLMVLGGGFAAMYREVGLPFEILTRVWNGFVYYARLIHAPEEERAALRESAPDRWRSMIPRSAAYWAAARRELEAMYAEIEAIRGTEPAAELAAAWERAWQHAGRAWEIHFVAILGPYQVLEDLIERYASIVEGANPADGLELVAGTVEELAATERELATLTAAAAAAPAIADRLRTVPAPTVDEIRALPGGPGFVHQLEDFLSRRGHLGTMCEDLTEPSWNADPRPLLGDIGRRLAADP